MFRAHRLCGNYVWERPSGAKARPFCWAFPARLKSCPVTKPDRGRTGKPVVTLKNLPPGLKPGEFLRPLAARLKPCPFKDASKMAYHRMGGSYDRVVLSSIRFLPGLKPGEFLRPLAARLKPCPFQNASKMAYRRRCFSLSMVNMRSRFRRVLRQIACNSLCHSACQVTRRPIRHRQATRSARVRSTRCGQSPSAGQ